MAHEDPCRRLFGDPRGGPLAPACSSDSNIHATDGGGIDATDGGDATVVVQAPDLRFKWVGAGLPMEFAGFTNLGTSYGTCRRTGRSA